MAAWAPLILLVVFAAIGLKYRRWSAGAFLILVAGGLVHFYAPPARPIAAQLGIQQYTDQGSANVLCRTHAMQGLGGNEVSLQRAHASCPVKADPVGYVDD